MNQPTEQQTTGCRTAQDASGLAELARQRGLEEKDLDRLRRPASASAVLPSGALIEDRLQLQVLTSS